jgi:glutamate-1-semialdehyde 2,1-aminomutase
MVSTVSTESSRRKKALTDYSLHHRAQDCIAQGYLTNSKRPQSLVKGVYPTHLTRGQGCYVWDARGKKYIDFITGLGTNLLGYANDTVIAAATNALSKGIVLSLGTPYEIEAAEKLKELFPWVDQTKFLKTGTEACAAAIRIARGKTGRLKVLSEGYHGWSEGFVSLTPPAIGCPSSGSLEFALLKDQPVDSRTAAVIVEPVMTDISAERIAFLKKLREECTKHRAMLIFDEVITGFRTPKYSMSAYFGIEPDIIVLGKAIANGFPLAAVAGKRSVMEGSEYFVSSTYAGCVDALAAARRTMELLQKNYKLDDLWAKGAEFVKDFNSIWPEMIRIDGYPTRGVFAGDPMTKALLFQEACFAGILFGPSFFFNFPLMTEAFSVIGTIRDIVYRIKSGNVTLLGEMPASPFAQKVREQ